MANSKRRRRGLTHRLIESEIAQAFGLDALFIVALALMGGSVYRLSPDLIWGYAGLVVLAAWWALGKAQMKGPKTN